MSHFAVLVPANDEKHLDAMLQPFHEFECTGENDQYVQEIDVTEKVLENGLDYYGLEDRTVMDEDQIDRDGDHKYGYALVDKKGMVIKAIDRTNPNRKWDWWQVGGRYSNLLHLNSPRGSKANSAKVSNIDFVSIRSQRSDLETARWEAFQALWDTVKYLDVSPDDIAEIKERWDSNEYMRAAFPNIADYIRFQKANTSDNDLLDWLDFEQIAQLRFWTLEAYREHYYNQAIVYAYIDPAGTWNGCGDMGWWGMDSNRRDDYDCKFWEMIASLSPDTSVYVVDCHI